MKLAFWLFGILSVVTALSGVEEKIQKQEQQIKSLHEKMVELIRQSREQQIRNDEEKRIIWKHIEGMEKVSEIGQPEICKK